MKAKIINIESEAAFPSEDEIEQIKSEIISDQPKRLIVAVDGFPGTGKSTIGRELKSAIAKLGISVELVATDLDFQTWDERPAGSNIIDWAGDNLAREILQNPGAEMSFKGYDVITHKRTNKVDINTPKNGIVILEGIRSVERALTHTNGDPVVAINFQISQEVAERLRIDRNVKQGRWKKADALERTAHQRKHLTSYFGDFNNEARKTTSTVRRELRTLTVGTKI